MPEISGNGTRCAGAFLAVHGHAGATVRIRTGAGIKTLRLLKRDRMEFEFEMDMGRPEIVAPHFALPLSSPGPRDVTLLSTGTPRCAVRSLSISTAHVMGAEIERHPHFPNRTNVSFVKPVDEHAIEVRIWERGAGETMSSGNGSRARRPWPWRAGSRNRPVKSVRPRARSAFVSKGTLFLPAPPVC